MGGVGPMVGGLLAFWGSPCLIDSVPATWVAQLVLSSLFFFRLPGQCQYLGLPVADYFKQWINLKKAYSFAMGYWPKNGLLDMNKGLSLQHTGRPHSGIDDCKNIANIMKTLACRGFVFKQTSKPF